MQKFSSGSEGIDQAHTENRTLRVFRQLKMTKISKFNTKTAKNPMRS